MRDVEGRERLSGKLANSRSPSYVRRRGKVFCYPSLPLHPSCPGEQSRGNPPFSFSTYRAYNSPCARASYTHLFLRYNEPGGRSGGGLSSEAVSSTAERRREREGAKYEG